MKTVQDWWPPPPPPPASGSSPAAGADDDPITQLHTQQQQQHNNNKLPVSGSGAVYVDRRVSPFSSTNPSKSPLSPSSSSSSAAMHDIISARSTQILISTSSNNHCSSSSIRNSCSTNIVPIIPAGHHIIHNRLSRPTFKLTNKTQLKQELLARLNLDYSQHHHPLPPSLQHPDVKTECLSRRQVHILSERRRRRGMSHLYATLQSLLPNSDYPSRKVDRSTVVANTIDYIQQLRGRLEELEQKKAEMMVTMGLGGGNVEGNITSRNANTTTSSVMEEEEVMSCRNNNNKNMEIKVKMCGRDAFVSVKIVVAEKKKKNSKKNDWTKTKKTKGVWPAILHVLTSRLHFDLLNVTFSAAAASHHYHSIHARMPAASDRRSSGQEVEEMLRAAIYVIYMSGEKLDIDLRV